jgi:hypothetical protein
VARRRPGGRSPPGADRHAGITTLRAQLQGDPAHDLPRQLDDLTHLLDLVHDVNAEAAAATVGDPVTDSAGSPPAPDTQAVT